jgi:nucleoside-diphosphate-sugar epimerase
MKLLISGAGGFLGQTLLSLLAARADVNSVIALDLKIDNIKEYKDNPKFFLLLNDDFLSQDLFLEGYTLINLAFARSQDFDLVKNSCEWTFNLLHKFEKNGGKRVVNISSQSIYDPLRTEPAKETDLPMLNELYDMGKYYIEKWVEEFCKKHNADFINLRLASIVGPSFSQRITTRLVTTAIKNKEISINLNGQIFSYTHVRDMSDAIISTCRIADSQWNQTYNVGSTEVYTIENIAHSIADTIGKYGITLKVNLVPSESNRRNSSLDSSCFQKVSGWRAKYSLNDIIEEELQLQINSV